MGTHWMQKRAVHLECSPWTAFDLELCHGALGVIAAAVCMFREWLDPWHGFTLKSGLTKPSHGRGSAWVYISTDGVLPPIWPS